MTRDEMERYNAMMEVGAFWKSKGGTTWLGMSSVKLIFSSCLPSIG